MMEKLRMLRNYQVFFQLADLIVSMNDDRLLLPQHQKKRKRRTNRSVLVTRYLYFQVSLI
jgi:hypothetical protein